jgi:hypothetical protein
MRGQITSKFVITTKANETMNRAIIAVAAALMATSAYSQGVTLTTPYTGNTVAEGSIDGDSMTLTNPNTGNTIAEGPLAGPTSPLRIRTLATR